MHKSQISSLINSSGQQVADQINSVNSESSTHVSSPHPLPLLSWDYSPRPPTRYLSAKQHRQIHLLQSIIDRSIHLEWPLKSRTKVKTSDVSKKYILQFLYVFRAQNWQSDDRNETDGWAAHHHYPRGAKLGPGGGANYPLSPTKCSPDNATHWQAVVRIYYLLAFKLGQLLCMVREHA